MTDFFDFLVYEVNDVGVRLGVSDEPMKDLMCGFTSRELAEDFLKYQKKVSRKKYYIKNCKKISSSK